jgi:N-acetyltransferase 10
MNAAKRGQKNVVVSVKSGKAKRKAGPTAAEIYDKEIGEKERKKVKLGRKAKMS